MSSASHSSRDAMCKSARGSTRSEARLFTDCSLLIELSLLSRLEPSCGSLGVRTHVAVPPVLVGGMDAKLGLGVGCRYMRADSSSCITSSEDELILDLTEGGCMLVEGAGLNALCVCTGLIVAFAIDCVWMVPSIEVSDLLKTS